MGMFSRKTPTPAETAEEMRASAKVSAASSRALRAAGAHRAADAHRRSAATDRVVARYAETGRCQFGHRNCTDGDH